MIYHMSAFALGFLIDLILGDPYWLYHPIRLIGNLIDFCDRKLMGEKTPDGEPTQGHNSRKERRKGAGLVLIVLLLTLFVTATLLLGSYWIHPWLGFAVETIMTYQILATKCLKVESMKVYTALRSGDLPASRYAVSMIVGRDTAVLDAEGIAKAAVETVAENTSDGVIAPMLFTAIGGPIAGFFYKAINTMDSMVGYKNERYRDFGTAAARLDDLVNYLPARLSALLLIWAAAICGKDYSAAEAWRIFRRDRYNHKSPNSAQTESVCAGALGIRLAGDASYFGKIVKKPFIGDDIRPVEYEDIRRVNRLLYAAAFTCELLCLAGMALFLLAVG